MTRKYKITTNKVVSSSSTEANQMLYGKELAEYENMDVDELLTKLSAEELEQLSNDVDPDVRSLIFHSQSDCTHFLKVKRGTGVNL